MAWVLNIFVESKSLMAQRAAGFMYTHMLTHHIIVPSSCAVHLVGRGVASRVAPRDARRDALLEGAIQIKGYELLMSSI